MKRQRCSVLAEIHLSADKRSAAVDEGMEAFVAGLARSDNPYPDDSPLRVYWERGWLIGEKHGHAH